MKKKILICTLIIIVLSVCGCAADKSYALKRTYLIYMNGSDLETNYKAASEDLKEIVSAKTGDNLSIYIYTGGTQKWHTEGISSDKNEVFKVQNNALVKLKSFDSANMGEASTLVQFVDFVYNQEGKCEYNIILWNHGGNALTGFGKDEIHSDDSLIVGELENAFDTIDESYAINFAFTAFDACLMANIETIFAIADHTDYIVASEEVVPACGFDYESFFKKQHKMMSPSDNAILLAKEYYRSAQNEYSSAYLSISVVDTEKIGRVADDFENAVTSSDINTERIMMFGGKTEVEGYSDMADMLSIFKDDSSTEVQNLIDSVNKAVIYMQNGRNCFGACGISIYFPYYVQDEDKTHIYAQSCFSQSYVNRIRDYQKSRSESGNKDISLEIEGVVYACEYCDSSLFFDYYSAYAYDEDENSICYRISKNKITEEVSIDAIFVGCDDNIGKSEEKYLKYR